MNAAESVSKISARLEFLANRAQRTQNLIAILQGQIGLQIQELAAAQTDLAQAKAEEDLTRTFIDP